MKCAHLLGMMLAISLSMSCSGSDDDPAADTTEASTDQDGVAEDVEEVDPRISCENACKRAPRCEQALVTEADCLALCAKAEPYETPFDYACCLQFAEGCAEVKACLEGFGSCEPKGEPWVQLTMFDACPCGDPDNPTPATHDCKSTAPDHPCPPTTICLKPPNSSQPPFCAIECTQKAPVCGDDLTCEVTPKFWYCKKK